MLLELIGVASLDDLVFKYAKHGTDTQFEYLIENIILDGNTKLSYEEYLLAPAKRHNLLVKVNTIYNIHDVQACFDSWAIRYETLEKCDNYGVIEYYIDVTKPIDGDIEYFTLKDTE